MPFDRRTFSITALGAVAAGPLGAQDSADSNCQRVRQSGEWRAKVLVDFPIGTKLTGNDLPVTFSFAHAESGVTLSYRSGRMGEPELTDLGDAMRRSDYFREIVSRENAGTRSFVITLVIEDQGSSWVWRVDGTAYWEVIPHARFSPTPDEAQRLATFLLLNPDSTLRASYFIVQNGVQEWVIRTTIDVRGYTDLFRQSEDMLRDLRTTANADACVTTCFLTTACCDLFGRPDDGWELRTLRAFRDGWLARAPGGAAEIARYYRIAPAICDAIRRDPQGDAELRRVYLGTILPCVALIRLRLPGAARRLYRRMVQRLERRYAPAICPAARAA